jgi:hypothetical protein
MAVKFSDYHGAPGVTRAASNAGILILRRGGHRALRLIERLRRDIGVNLAGLGVVLDLLNRLCSLQRENERLRSRL